MENPYRAWISLLCAPLENPFAYNPTIYVIFGMREAAIRISIQPANRGRAICPQRMNLMQHARTVSILLLLIMTDGG